MSTGTSSPLGASLRPGGVNFRVGDWLPAPEGPIYKVMWLYWPKTEQPSTLATGEGTWSPPAVQKVE